MSQLTTFDASEAVNSIDGPALKALTRAALAWLERNHEHVNSLNVFPVPDGDTGTNMLLTMRSAWREIAEFQSPLAGEVAQKVYNGALMGARGNSGVILSQLWRGFARGLEGQAVISAANIGKALTEASRTAYSAVQTPVEGTLLTVAREAGEEAMSASGELTDMRAILDRILERSRDSVRRTPDLLPVLKEAGVVDSGGMGFTYMLEGMLRYMNGEAILEAEPVAAMAAGEKLERTELTEEEAAFPYDVQFLIKGENLDVTAIRGDIEAMGASGVIVGDSTLVKVHIHVVDPSVPISYGIQRGALLDVVVENMIEQFNERMAGQAHPLEVDEVPPPQIESGSIAVVIIAPGRGFRNLFYNLGAGCVIDGGQTMNPSTAEILDAIMDLPTDRIIVLPNNKNIIMAAQQAAEQSKVKQVVVVPSSTIPQGVAALLALDPFGEIEGVSEEMQRALRHVQTGEVTRATRDARLDGIKVKNGQVIGLLNDKLTFAGSAVDEVVFGLLDQMSAGEHELITFYYGEMTRLAEAEALAEQVRDRFPDQEIEVRPGGQAHYDYIFSVE